MSEDSESRDRDEELEALLRGLEPTPLDVGRISELHRERERIAFEFEQSPARMQWRRLIPLTLVSMVVTLGFALFQYGDRLRSSEQAPASPSVASAPATEATAEPRFVPVSTYGTVVNTSSGGVIETESGPRQRLNIEFQDAYHWHDPESGTNIRYFVPRSEEVIVPLQTD